MSGEVTLAPALKAKAAAGETLFIVAKSVDSPGAPVAVFRGSVGNWPLKFTLDDSQSMLPGRNFSSAGRVTIEARISQKGQPLPASGDLQGSTGCDQSGGPSAAEDIDRPRHLREHRSRANFPRLARIPRPLRPAQIPLLRRLARLRRVAQLRRLARFRLRARLSHLPRRCLVCIGR